MKNVIQIVNNTDNKYPGDLKHYLKIIWNSPNVNVPYHNIRHMLHVMWATYQGAEYYNSDISPRMLRNMLIAALFHDYNHPGKTTDDSKNIKLAIDGLSLNILPEDKSYFVEISNYIRATQFPHLDIKLDLAAKIIRDADISYTLYDVWIHTVNFGLSQEIGISPEQMLKGQSDFLKTLRFETEWAEKEYRERINSRIEESNDLYKALYE